ncbi:hypothetical protein H6P81_009547 [Aristolochia fimbriata]|uniref:AB hydrolase-1 domain-containing protein n=1 Tax=Aristolochia fimbriata TaxID=158543 RepID=A0AAV7EPB9_ARIFI|nr:hypothetical protein H6P81_009547 [Aristolochia fimbriata]
MLHAGVRPAVHFAATMCYLHPTSLKERNNRPSCPFARSISSGPIVASIEPVERMPTRPAKKPSICTADELHYVPVPGTVWRLALWRYTPPPDVPPRNHPLMLLSGVGTNAIGFDLSPESSFARYMSRQGFDTWIVEVRGAGLSIRDEESSEAENFVNKNLTSKLIQTVEQDVQNAARPAEQQQESNTPPLKSGTTNVKEDKQDSLTAWDETQLVTKLSDTLLGLIEKLSGFLSERQLKGVLVDFIDQLSKLLEDTQLSDGFNEIREKLTSLLESRQNNAFANQVRDLSERIVNIVEEGQRSVSPRFLNLQERLSKTIEDFQKQLDLIVKYDWDFDNYLEEDVPTAMEYIISQTKPKDGKLLAIGHSMGGILLYARLSQYAFRGGDPGLSAVVTLASSLDYTSSRSSLKLLLPLADPAQALNVPVVPLGVLMAAAYPLASRPPYVLAWLSPQVSADDMMHPELFERLVLKNFCTIPAKLLLQLTTAFRTGGLCDRNGNFFYKNHLSKTNVPVLALAGDQDLICPPEAVYETVEVLPQHLVTYKLFGQPSGPHYGHYDLVGGRLMVDEVFPCIIEFLSHHDT